MDLVVTLRTARVLLFAAVLVLLISIGIRKRAQWWQITWLILFVAHQLTFTVFVLFAQWQGIETDLEFMRAWAAAVDLHLGIAALTYLLVLSRSPKNVRRAIPHDRRTGADIDQRVAYLAAQWEQLGIKPRNEVRRNHTKPKRTA